MWRREKRTSGKMNPSETKLYKVWTSMKQRCLNPKDKAYKNYGGRGIKVCDRWVSSFSNFIADMGDKPNTKATLERVDNNGDYTPNNCIWCDRHTQCNNLRKNVWLVFQGQRKTIAQWSRCVGICRVSIRQRLLRGWSIRDALMTPVGTHKNNVRLDGKSRLSNIPISKRGRSASNNS